MSKKKENRSAASVWMRGTFLSGSPAGVLQGITDLVYYAAFLFCFGWTFVRSTTMFSRIMPHEQKEVLNGIYEAAVLAAIACAAIWVLLQKNIYLAVFEVILLTAGYFSWKSGGEQYYLFAMCALIAGAAGRSFRAILHLYLFLGTLLTACALVASQTGIIKDLVYPTGRHSFGSVYCTDCAARILFLAMAFLMLRIESMRLRDYLPLVPGLVLMYFTRAKTNILCCLFMIAGTVLYHLVCRWKGRDVWKIPAAVLCLSFPAGAALSVGAALLVNVDDPVLRARLNSIDYTLVKRIELGRRALTENPVTLFGTNIHEKGFGGKADNLPGWDKYFFIDSSFIRLLAFGGILLFLLLLAVLTYAQLRCFASRKYGCVFLLAVLAMVCIMEHHLIEFYYNVFPLMAFSGSGFFRKRQKGRSATTEEVRQEPPAG